MSLLRLVIPVLFFIKFTAAFTYKEKNLIESLIEELKPHHALFATEREVYRSIQINSFLLSQWIDGNELQNRGLGRVFVRSRTVVIVQTDYADRYFQNYFEVSNWLMRSPNGPFHYSHTWLIIQTERGPALDLESFKVPYNCEFYYVRPINDSDYEIIEKYDWDNKLTIFRYGTWSPSQGLTVPNSDFYARRMNLNGLTLKISKPWARTCEPVICIQQEIWKGISAIMNITSKEAIFNQDVITTSSVSSITGAEFNTDLEWAPPRPHVGPIYTMRVYMHVKRIGKETAGWKQFFKPFHFTMWLAVTALIVITTATSVFLQFSVGGRVDPDIIFHPLAIFSNQGESSMNQEYSIRIVNLSTSIAAMVVIPIYSAAVLSAIMISVEKLPFIDLEGLTKQPGYKIAGVYDKFSVDYMNMEKKYQNIVENHFAKNMPLTLNEGYERLCSEDKFVFLGYNNFIVNEPALKCRVLKIPNYLFSSTVSFRLNNYSPFVKVFNRNLIKFHTSGILSKLGKEADGREPVDEDDGKTSPVQLPHVLFPIYVVAAGVFISVALLLTEMFFSSCKR